MISLLDMSVPLGLGVVSSLHCAQMCGPIVLAYSMGGRSSPTAHLSYNAGRIAMYSILGAVAGQAMGLASIQRTASVVSGVLMIAAGIIASGFVARPALVQIGVSSRFSRLVGRLITSPGTLSKLALGLLTGFLPCGLLFAALLKAASTGSAVAGALSMTAFGIGTASSLLALGLASSVFGFRLGRWSRTFASVAIILTGVTLVLRGFLVRAPEMSCHAGL